ncbi:uncharacterized protein [Lolium perenne]|uniref:uncharacterized protein isoform X2 n=1 Tax=Lolium perenne TaxID=4522 RepID=UPI0021F5B0AD|nr:uncharacterized protein LOC127299824 isoform X2 [Lolium perenne]
MEHRRLDHIEAEARTVTGAALLQVKAHVILGWRVLAEAATCDAAGRGEAAQGRRHRERRRRGAGGGVRRGAHGLCQIRLRRAQRRHHIQRIQGRGHGEHHVRIISGHRLRDAHSMGSRFRVPEEDSCDSESVASNFEFHKVRGASARSAPAAAVPPFSKHPPSKWDDAQKWIAGPTTNRPSRACNGAFPRKMEKSGFGGGRLPATKVVLEATKVLHYPAK